MNIKIQDLKILPNFLCNRIKNVPFILAHSLTYKCNLKCKICEFYKKNNKNELKLDEIFKMLDDAKKMGMVYYIITGGEPLLNDNLAEIVEYAKKLGFRTSIITNGILLKDRIKEIRKFIDVITVSIDGPNHIHNKIRNSNIAFKKAIEGLIEAKKNGIKVKIASTICKININYIKQIAGLAKKNSVPVIFQPMLGYSKHLKKIELNNFELIKYVKEVYWLKKNKYPVINSSYALLSILNHKPFYKCYFPNHTISIDPEGNVIECLNSTNLNIKYMSFRDIFKSEIYKKFLKKSKSCKHFCRLNCATEFNGIYTFKYSELLHFLIS